MAENVNEKLFSEFAPTTTQEWLDKVTADLKGADFNKKLVWRTNEGFNVQPMYRLENMKDLKNLECFPGEFPFVRGNKKDNNNWFVRQDIVVEDAAEANRKALDVLNRGVDSLGFVMTNCKNFTKADMETLLKDICLECVEVNFTLCCNKVAILKMFQEVVSERGIDPEKDLKLHIGLFGGEGMTEPMRDEMHKVWGDQFVCTQNYGMSELCGPGVAGECTELCGMHVNEDWFIPEIIDPETEEVLPPGELGELVVTCLGKEALPLVRYRTGDLTRLMYEPCKCGRTTCRMENISGRADDMLVIRGVNVFPTQIEEVLLKIDEIGPHYEILVERRNRLDVMTITVELIDDRLLDSYAKLSQLESRIKKALKAQLGLATQIRLVAPNSLQRFEGKAKRVTDLRKDGL